jgi:hypothetical protein
MIEEGEQPLLSLAQTVGDAFFLLIGAARGEQRGQAGGKVLALLEEFPSHEVGSQQARRHTPMPTN